MRVHSCLTSLFVCIIESFKEFIYCEVYELLTGMDVCKITIKLMREQCYPIREGKSVLPEVEEAQKQAPVTVRLRVHVYKLGKD